MSKNSLKSDYEGVLRSRQIQDGATTPVIEVQSPEIHLRSTQTRHLRKKSTSLEQSLPSPETPSTTNAQSRQSTKDQLRSKVNRDPRHQTFYQSLIEFIPDKLYFGSLSQAPEYVPSDAYIFSVDNEFVYAPFFSDFGPLSISNIIKFGRMMEERLKDQNLIDSKLVLLTSKQADKLANASLLICSYMVLYKNCSPEQTISILNSLNNITLVPFRDAGYGAATYWIDVLDCLRALQKGVLIHKFIDLHKFNTEEYDFYERVENGDWNWILPNFFIALATPHEQPLPHLVKYHQDVRSGRIIPLKQMPKNYTPLIDLDLILKYYNQNNVKGLVRLNNALYDRNRVLKAGVQHYELYFPDGSVPNEAIIRKFLQICDDTLPYNQLKSPYNGPLYGSDKSVNRGALAVHCKAGLGRTGSLICCWMIRTFGWSAKDCISWCRLMRPGSVVGPQQNWLESMEPIIKRWAHEERILHHRQSRDYHVDTTINRGVETIAQSTMGMSVPSQPRKIEVQQPDLQQYNQQKQSQNKTNQQGITQSVLQDVRNMALATNQEIQPTQQGTKRKISKQSYERQTKFA